MKTILVVEDEREIREMICSVLEAAGYAVHTAQNIEVAWDMLEANSFDLVVCDFCLPQSFPSSGTSAMEGATLIANMNEHYSEVPIIGMSALVGKERIENLSSCRVQHMLEEPFQAQTLLETVRSILG